MSKATRFLTLMLAGGLMLSGSVMAHGGGTDVVKPNFEHPLPNIPGKSLKAVEVIYAPGAKSVPHTHASSAFIYAYVVEGKITSQVAGEPKQTYSAGESWYEEPGAHHILGENASKTEPAKLLAVFVVDTNEKALTIPDKTDVKK